MHDACTMSLLLDLLGVQRVCCSFCSQFRFQLPSDSREPTTLRVSGTDDAATCRLNGHLSLRLDDTSDWARISNGDCT
jgi:hypothetical protein